MAGSAEHPAAQKREPVRISEFTSPDEPRFSCLVTPTPNGDWWWSVFSGDGSVPGSLVRGSSRPTSLSGGS